MKYGIDFNGKLGSTLQVFLFRELQRTIFNLIFLVKFVLSLFIATKTPRHEERLINLSFVSLCLCGNCGLVPLPGLVRVRFKQKI